MMQFELQIDGEPVWVDMGQNRENALLMIIIKIIRQEPEAPDN